MKRPIGITLSAIALGLLAGLTLLSAAATSFGAFAIRKMAQPMPVTPGSPAAPSNDMIFAILVIFSLVLAAIAVWEIFATIGLFRLRSWARYSILVIGGLLTFLGLFSALGISLAAFMMPKLVPPTHDGQPLPHLMQAVLLIYALFYLVIAAVGIWWLVYFNLRRTKGYFAPEYAIDPVFYPGEPGDPRLYRATGRFARTPTSVMVIAWLFLISGVMCFGFCWVPLPAYLLGFILTGVWPHLLYAAIAVMSGLIGWGLLHLDNRARLGSYGFMVYGIINFATMLTPWGRGHYAEYQTQINERMGVLTHPPQLVDPTSFGFILFMAVTCLIFYVVQIWILEKHRRAFTVVLPPPIEQS